MASCIPVCQIRVRGKLCAYGMMLIAQSSKSGSFCEGGAKREGTGNSQEQNTQLFATFLLLVPIIEGNLHRITGLFSQNQGNGEEGSFTQVK